MANPKDRLVGSRIREYEILEVIGKGGMGAVYRARHVYLQTERAIKVIHSQFVDDAEQVERFIREARILTEVQHPNLVQLFDFGMLENQVFFMVMELLKGESVLQRIRNSGKIPISDSLRIIREAAQALHCAHQKGIVHRDISPDNLLLVKDASGKATTKVIDFGIAKPLVETSFRTATNVFLGKPEYCSPEQCGILEAGEVIDKRCDIYSLAVTFYHMLTGQLPFYATTPQGYLVKHAVEPPKPPSVYLADLGAPPELDKVILKALSKKREERHQSLEEFLFDLDSISLESRKSGSGKQSAIDKLTTGAMFANRYLIETKLGQGGMGRVYKAIDKVLDVPVAVKVMTRRIAEDERMLERLKREVILARKVAHSNVCRTYDIGEFEGSHYVSMEFIEGITLSQMIRKQGRLSLEKGADIVKQILEGLQEAHEEGVVHRDLKPQNIMIDARGEPHIMDFGISTSADSQKITQQGFVVGTPDYMAPELFEDTPVDHRADIYSIGIIMFEIFTGQLPFSATTPMAMMVAHMKSTPKKPSDVVAGFPEELESIILKCLDRNRQNRYQTPRELLAALCAFAPDRRTEEFLQSRVEVSSAAPTSALTPPVSQTIAPLSSPKRLSTTNWIVWLLAVAIPTLLLFFGFAYYILTRPKPVQKVVAVPQVAPKPKAAPKPIQPVEPPKKEVQRTKPAPVAEPAIDPEPQKSEPVAMPLPVPKTESKPAVTKREEPKPAPAKEKPKPVEVAKVIPPPPVKEEPAPAAEIAQPKPESKPEPVPEPEPERSQQADSNTVESTNPVEPSIPVQPKPEVIATKGMLVFFRPDDPFVGNPIIFLDSVELGRLIKGHYFRVEIAPGSHRLSFKASGYLATGQKIDAEFTGSGDINVEAGKEYYIKVIYERYTMMWSTNPRMRGLIQRLRPAEPRDIKNREMVIVP